MGLLLVVREVRIMPSLAPAEFSRRDLDPRFRFRKPTFYPLNYGKIGAGRQAGQLPLTNTISKELPPYFSCGELCSPCAKCRAMQL